MSMPADTRSTPPGLTARFRDMRTPLFWGVVWGGLQAASPLGFWWLDPATVYAEVVPEPVELRRRPGHGQAALMPSSCTTGAAVLRVSASRAARRAGRCRWPLTRRN